MKKSIFLSVLALAAVVSCQKSEIVDTKYGNEAIGFETYTGRDAQTKAVITDNDNLTEIGLYGFYLGNGTWTTSSVANLWKNTTVTSVSEWKPSPEKYWANSTDNYCFLAYAPVASIGTKLTITETDPTLTYTVPGTLSDQIDLIVSNNQKSTTKPSNSTVALQFEHALARLTVKAEAEDGDFSFHVKEVSITGAFKPSGTYNLYNGAWAATGVAGTKYTFYTNTDVIDTDVKNAADKLVEVDYAKLYKNTANEDNNYLMMIPVDFTTTAAKLYVKYTTYYMGKESNPIEKYFDVKTNFLNGKAYAINLMFEQNLEKIQFTVDVTDWVSENNAETSINAGDVADWTASAN